ncbi:MAG: class I SAM-dependent methyltransferase [Acidimicrobiia bacterium]
MGRRATTGRTTRRTSAPASVATASGFLQAAAVGYDERVLDIGCGTGETTRDLARAAPAGTALGVDLSSRMLALARRRAAEQGLTNACFLQADALVHPFTSAAFDLAVSRTGAMLFGDPVAAFTNIARALRPDGRLVLLTWQSLDENPWILEFAEALAGGRNVPSPPPTPQARSRSLNATRARRSSFCRRVITS